MAGPVKLQFNVVVPEHITLNVGGTDIGDAGATIVESGAPGEVVHVAFTAVHDLGTDGKVIATASATDATWSVNVSPASWDSMPVGVPQTGTIDVTIPATAVAGTDVCDINFAINPV